MRILLIGSSGQLGWEFQRTLPVLGEVLAIDYPEIDLANPSSIEKVVRGFSPEVLVNAAAYTDVDRAESEQASAFAINATAPKILAQEAKNLGATFLHFSTDYVFDGKKNEPYLESDAPNPINVYGKSKLAGEQAVQGVGGAYLILRTSWVYSLRRKCFLTQVLNWSRQQKEMWVVTDQVASPTSSHMLAAISTQILMEGKSDLYECIKERNGVYHLAGQGSVSRYDWAQAILEKDSRKEEQIVELLHPARTSKFPAPAQRPVYSALSCDKIQAVFNVAIEPWEISLGAMLASGEPFLN